MPVTRTTTGEALGASEVGFLSYSSLLFIFFYYYHYYYYYYYYYLSL